MNINNHMPHPWWWNWICILSFTLHWASSVWNLSMAAFREKEQKMQKWRMTGRSDGGWGTPSRGWDRTSLCTSNVCHSRKLMMPRSWANHPPAAFEKRDRQTEREDWGWCCWHMDAVRRGEMLLRRELGVGHVGENWRSKNIYDNQHPGWHRWVILK